MKLDEDLYLMLYRTAVLLILGTLVGFLFCARTVFAYALPGTSATATAPDYASSSFYFGTWSTGTWQNLSAPFLNFSQSLQAIGKTNLNVTIPVSVPTVPNVTDVAPQVAHNAFEQFDGWLAGMTGGFHIAAFLTVFLQIMSWLLGVVKGSVDWLLGWMR